MGTRQGTWLHVCARVAWLVDLAPRCRRPASCACILVGSTVARLCGWRLNPQTLGTPTACVLMVCHDVPARREK